MNSLITPDNFEFFARYLLAGWIIILMRSRSVAGLRPRATDLLMETVIFSLGNQLAWLMITSFFLVPLNISLSPRISFFAEILVLPVTIGLLLGWSLTFSMRNAFLRRLALPVTHPVERAHDFAFQDRPACFVILTYHDGIVIRGYFGEKSLAASDQTRSDIYLERLYDVGEQDQWIEPGPGRSGLFDLTTVRSIEFLDGERKDGNR